MTTNVPSFDSFPPSFSTFPDLDEPGPSRPKEAQDRDDNRTSERSKAKKERARNHPQGPHVQREANQSRSPGSKPRSKHSAEKDSIRSSKHSKANTEDVRHESRRRDGGERRKRLDSSHAQLFAHDEEESRRKRRRNDGNREQDPETRYGLNHDLDDDSDISQRPLFIEDPKGDMENMRLGAPRGSSVPKYGRAGYAFVLGCPPGWKAHRGKELELRPPIMQKALRYTSKKWAARVAAIQPRKLLSSLDAAAKLPPFEEDIGFIALPNTRQAKQDDPDEPKYRSITRDAHDSSSLAGSSDEAGDHSSDDDEFTIPSTTLGHTNAILNQHVEDNPTSVSAWLQLLAHSVQDAPSSDARANIGMAILEKALRVDRSNNWNPVLQAKYLALGEHLWTNEKLAESWDDALRHVTAEFGSFDERCQLWMDYITWKVRCTSMRGLEEAVAMIRQISESPNQGKVDAETRSRFALRLLWRSSVALADMGYYERAVAAFQAQIELTLCMPQNLIRTPFESKLDALEMIWDAELPRAGELGWVGWSSQPSVPTSDVPHLPPTSHRPSNRLRKPGRTDPYVAWAEEELTRDRSCHVPLRGSAFQPPNSNEEDDDPYATILFSDIRPFLFDPTILSSSEQGHEALDEKECMVYAFMQFLGLHFPGLSAHLDGRSQSAAATSTDIKSAGTTSWASVGDSAWSVTRFSTSNSLRSLVFGSLTPALNGSEDNDRRQRLETSRQWESVLGVIIGKEEQPKGSAGRWGPIKEWTWGTRRPLDCIWESMSEGGLANDTGRQWEGDTQELADKEFIGYLFTQLSPILQSERFDELWLAFEVASTTLSGGIKKAVKLSKNLLRQSQNDPKSSSSLRRWGTHAKLERLRGKFGDARKVYENATSAGSQHGLEALFWEWAEMEWLLGNNDRVKDILSRAATTLAPSSSLSESGSRSSTAVGPTASGLLRARKILEDHIRVLLKQGRSGEDLLSAVNLSALLELIIKGTRYQQDSSDVQAALAKYVLPLEGSRLPSLSEALAVSSSQLLYYHTKILKSPLPPVIFRTHTEELVTKAELSGNTCMLGMWIESERGAADGRGKGRISRIIRRDVLRIEDTVNEDGNISVGGWGGDGIGVERCLWCVWKDTGRQGPNPNSWEAMRARGVLARALEGDRSRMSTSLWTVAIDLEVRLGQLMAAKSLLYRAIGQCPWAKDLYLLAFTQPLRSMFTAKELNQWLNTMAERQIRIRINIEDLGILDQAHERRSPVSEHGEGGGDEELEYDAKERRRLMPY